MTEHEWLTSERWETLWDYIAPKLTPETHELIIKAFQSVAFHADWYERRPDIIRDIVGSPFRPIMKKVGVTKTYMHPTDGYNYYDNENFPKNAIRFDPAWLTWGDRTIPLMVDAMMNEDCDECGTLHGETGRWRFVSIGPDSHWERCDCTNGRIPRAEPRWEMMPVIADALEEAGCADPHILEHLRSLERCQRCDGQGMTFIKCSLKGKEGTHCSHCKGTGRIKRRHYIGCHIIELLKGTSL